MKTIEIITIALLDFIFYVGCVIIGCRIYDWLKNLKKRKNK